MIENIYCDESCHLLNDGIPVMVLGCISCNSELVQSIHNYLRNIKVSHGLSRNFECKWVKVSPSKYKYYESVLDYFFENEALRFRGTIIPNKNELQHDRFNQDHFTWYHKMWYIVLEKILESGNSYKIYIDIQNTHSYEKTQVLKDILNTKFAVRTSQKVTRIQPVRSHEVELMQMVDLLIGAIAYTNRGLSSSRAKSKLVEHFQERSGLSLKRTTKLASRKVNILKWQPQL